MNNLIGQIINDNYIKVDEYKNQRNFLLYYDRTNQNEIYEIGDKVEIIVDDYNVLEIVGIYNEPIEEVIDNEE